jgi:hypothetical protein
LRAPTGATSQAATTQPSRRSLWPNSGVRSPAARCGINVSAVLLLRHTR